MSPINHFMTGWILANSISDIRIRERGYITATAVVADIDGLGIIAELLTKNSANPWLWWSQYHHILAHNLWFGLLLTCLAFCISQHRTIVAILVFVSFHLHLFEDLLSGRANTNDIWGIQYLYPLSHEVWQWQGQWLLNAWPNMLIAILLIASTFYLAWKKSYSPLVLIAPKLDALFITSLQQRFGYPK